ncbi:MAG: hypothetical protein KAT04_05960 [Methylococcales bacterium]|nr:hypothetical protein [Methylococcales bacterium]
MTPSELTPDFIRIIAALAKLVILAMLLERALVLIFDYRWFKQKLDGLGFKIPISFGTAWMICNAYHFDVLSVLFEPDKTSELGVFMTAAIAAGGSAGAITLFQSVFKFNKEAQTAIKDAQKAEARARQKKAEAEIAEYEARIKKPQ